MKKLQVQLNPYLEFINSILLTGKYNEITAPVVGYGLMNEEENEYTAAVRAHFEPYKEHGIYAYVEEMIPQGFTFARPVELALSLGTGVDYERLKPFKLPGFQSGYGDWQECVNEHLVRAMVIHLLRRCGLYKEAEKQLQQDFALGYSYIPLLLESYENYDRNRELYPDFKSYYPKLLKVFLEDFREE